MSTKSINWNLDVTLKFFVVNGKEFDSLDEMHAAIYNYRTTRLITTSGSGPVTVAGKMFQVMMIRKLVEEKLISQSGPANYAVTIEGRIFHSSPIWWYKRRPFAYEHFKKNLQTVWNIVKIVALVLNALAILYIGYMAAVKN